MCYFNYNKAPLVAEWFCTRISRMEVPDSILGRACRPSRPSDFSVVFSETSVSTG